MLRQKCFDPADEFLLRPRRRPVVARQLSPLRQRERRRQDVVDATMKRIKIFQWSELINKFYKTGKLQLTARGVLILHQVYGEA